MAKSNATVIIGIDPGTNESGWVLYKPNAAPEDKVDSGIMNNQQLCVWLSELSAVPQVVIEMMSCYGMAIGRDTMETLVWIGRFMQAADPDDVVRIYRHKIRLHLCNSARARDTNIRQVLIDRFGPGKGKAIGLKKTPGPLYGVSKHAWAALAVAVTYHETQGVE